MDPSAGGSSTSATRPSPGSRRSAKGSARSGSSGESGGIGRSALRALAERHGVRPTKSLGQHFIVDPNLARAIVADAGVGPGDRVLEVGAGFGSITVALAEAGCEVVALEFDRQIVPALLEVVAGSPNVRVEQADAMRVDWPALLGDGPWALVANLPYNISVPLVLTLLERVPAIASYVVMVQREVGDRFVAGPGEPAYGSVSLRVAYRADVATVRRVPAEVFWPRPSIDSVLVRLRPRPAPVDVDPDALFRVVDESFAERRKTMRNALRRLGLAAPDAVRVLEASGVSPAARAEQLGLDAFARVTTAILAEGWRP
ncbi:MAG TPA: 16S rRNA (adenine(1518)-N(6)/adenine(1519)-N(6))-dimethyltransferase RsmA [Actinomycetota bacterium]